MQHIDAVASHSFLGNIFVRKITRHKYLNWANPWDFEGNSLFFAVGTVRGRDDPYVRMNYKVDSLKRVASQSFERGQMTKVQKENCSSR